MNAPRLTLSWLMAGVALVAANLAFLRAAGARGIDLLVVAGPPFVLFQVAAWRAWTRRRPGRAYWVGYLLLAGLATGTLVWGETHRAVHGRLPGGRIGVIQPGSPCHRAWQGYFLSLANVARPHRWLVDWMPGSGFFFALIGTYGSQVGPGMLGGWIGRRLAAAWRAGPIGDGAAMESGS